MHVSISLLIGLGFCSQGKNWLLTSLSRIFLIRSPVGHWIPCDRTLFRTALCCIPRKSCQFIGSGVHEAVSNAFLIVVGQIPVDHGAERAAMNALGKVLQVLGRGEERRGEALFPMPRAAGRWTRGPIGVILAIQRMGGKLFAGANNPP